MSMLIKTLSVDIFLLLLENTKQYLLVETTGTCFEQEYKVISLFQASSYIKQEVAMVTPLSMSIYLSVRPSISIKHHLLHLILESKKKNQ